jgi:transcriptional regulator with XRE-family HTH domain
MSTTTLSLEIRRLRERSGYSLRGLGSRLHVSASHLSDIEHDRRRPSEKLLKGLAYELRETGTTFAALEAQLTGIDAKTVEWAAITPGVRPLFRRLQESGLLPPDLLRVVDRAISRFRGGGRPKGR